MLLGVNMVVVSPDLVLSYLDGFLKYAFNFLENDQETQALLSMANVMAVTRLMYNDHGSTHSRIVAGSALAIMEILEGSVKPSVVRDGIGDYEDSKLVVLLGAYLHDIGNAVHRDMHHVHGCLLASNILDRLLPRIYENDRWKVYRVKQEVLHCIFSHDEDVRCLSVEAGVVKVADGTDMAEGRARIPYDKGRLDIHTLSALAVKKVELEKGKTKPLRIKVDMRNPAGIFQVERVLGRKIASSGLADKIEVTVTVRGRVVRGKVLQI